MAGVRTKRQIMASANNNTLTNSCEKSFVFLRKAPRSKRSKVMMRQVVKPAPRRGSLIAKRAPPRKNQGRLVMRARSGFDVSRQLAGAPSWKSFLAATGAIRTIAIRYVNWCVRHSFVRSAAPQLGLHGANP
jgi:hypothetical protein